MANETISEKCETLYNKLNAFVTSVISRDVTPKISNLNTEVWGSDTQTGNSRIDTLNTKFDNLDGSITSMESDINNVESDVSNLQTSVNSLSTSITNLTGFTRVYNGYDNRIMVYTNGILAYFIMQGTFVVNSSGKTSIGSIPSQYAPIAQTTTRTHPSSLDGVDLGSDGSITYYVNSGKNTNRIVHITYCYPLKSSLGV